MKTIMINDISFEYLSKQEITKSNSPQLKNLKMLYKFGEYFSAILGIDCPDLASTGSVRRDPYTLLDAVTFTEKDLPYLKRPIVIFSEDIFIGNHEKNVVGTLAHELYHVYQDQHPNHFKKTPTYSFEDSLFDEREIDADAFAICMISKIYNMSIRKAGSIFCHDIKINNKNAYNQRIKKAKSKKNDIFYKI